MPHPISHVILATLPLAGALAPLAAGPIAPDVGALYNLIKNSGFEEGDRLPAAWARYPAKDAGANYQLRDTKMFHTGRASGLITSVVGQPPGTSAMQWSQYKVPVEGGSSVIVSMYAKSEGVPVHGGGLHFYDETGAHRGFVGVQGPATPATNWTHLHQTVAVPPEARTMGFVAYARNGGKTWYDDLAVIGTPTADATRFTPTLDGQLTEPCWDEARAIKTFVAHTGAKIIAEPIRAWLAYDDTKLYAAFRCPHRPRTTLRAQASAHDGDVWLDDSVEVFLDPRHRHHDYIHLCVNCNGILRDSRGRDTAWESGARVVVAREETAWAVELEIPFERLDLDLDVGHAWGVNLVWNNRVDGETATWSLGGFHAPGRFGNVTLSPDLGRFYRPQLARHLEQLRHERRGLFDELQGADLPGGGRAQSRRLLDEAMSALDDMRQFTKTDARSPDGGWDDICRRLTMASGTIAAARSAAVASLYETGQPGGKGAFRVVIAHSLQKVRRSGPVNDGILARQIRLDAARDEAESFQLVMVPGGGPLKQVTVEAGPLTGDGGKLPLTWHRVGYVETAKPNYPTEYVGWWPDPLLAPGAFDVAADERQPLWFTVDVPPETKPGAYGGPVTIRHGNTSLTVPVELRVRSFRLPRPGSLATPFSLYQQAWAKWWFGKETKKMPIETFARWCEFLGRYRLTPKNIAREYITQSGGGGNVRVDLSPLEQTVVPLAPRYFAPYSFNLCRMPSAKSIGKAADTTDPADAASLARAWVDEWKRLKLPAQVFIYGYDEPRPEHYSFLREAYRRIREAAPGYPIMQTLSDQQPAALAGLVDIWCPLTPSLASSFYGQRRRARDTLWTYVCCSPKPPFANFFVDEPAIDHRILFWQARQYGATGLLYWSTAWWEGLTTAASGEPCFPDTPIRFADLGTYQEFKVNGDGLLLYPGKGMEPLPSIRLEVIRDGIEDYECLALLSRTVERAMSLPADKQPAPQLMEKSRGLCKVPESISRRLDDYTKDPGAIFERRRKINDAIEQLTIALEQK
ncbi:MAG TPA: DUF6067 family protein [Verrucomicrobiae bacterium]|nr:DUF6067 family protein [Verrucomicrobiae bacterium]